VDARFSSGLTPVTLMECTQPPIVTKADCIAYEGGVVQVDTRVERACCHVSNVLTTVVNWRLMFLPNNQLSSRLITKLKVTTSYQSTDKVIGYDKQDSCFVFSFNSRPCTTGLGPTLSTTSIPLETRWW
jgi:hypothetical protein